MRTTVSGAVYETCASLPFGDGQTCAGADVSQVHFTGKERDSDSGLDYFGARYNSAGMGRWMSADWSAVPMALLYAFYANPQSMNLYSCMRNNPLGGTDPDGHCGAPGEGKARIRQYIQGSWPSQFAFSKAYPAATSAAQKATGPVLSVRLFHGGLMVKGGFISLLMIVAFACMGGTNCKPQGAQNQQAGGPAKNLSRGIGCLVTQDWVADDLRELGLRVGGTAKARYETGSIPGVSPESPTTTNVLLLSPHGSRGWLLFFRTQADGTIAAVRNGYRVKRIDGVWTASEGNGGVATYKAMGDYVTRLAKRPTVSVPLTPVADGCRLSE